MPITPHFELSQTDDHVIIRIRVPHVRVSFESVQVVLTDENRCLHFASQPYLLVLTFSNAFEENADEACAQYDPFQDHGRIVLRLAKASPGLWWDDLDMVGALVKPRAARQLQEFVTDACTAGASTSSKTSSIQKSNWIKQVLNETTDFDGDGDNDGHENKEQNDGIDSRGSATDGENNRMLPLHQQQGYGFCHMFQNVFADLARDGLAREMLEIPLNNQRHVLEQKNTILSSSVVVQEKENINYQQQRQDMEVSKFNQERYLEDLHVEDDYLYQVAMDMRPHWSQLESHQSPTPIPAAAAAEAAAVAATNNTTPSQSYFSAEESAQLASIPYPLLPRFTTVANERYLWWGVLDLLFAYCYDHLLTGGDPTVESAWNISILSVTLSWLESFQDYDDDGDYEHDTTWSSNRIVLQSTRRSLIYPYLRNLEFAIYVWKQVSQILRLGGRRCVVRCLLQVRNILDQSELYYLGNKLYIDPYLAWLQDSRRHENDDRKDYLHQLSSEIEDVVSDSGTLKRDIGLDLLTIEREACRVEEEDEECVISNSSSESSSEEESSEDEEDQSPQDEITLEDKSGTAADCHQESAKTSNALLDDNIGKSEAGRADLIVTDLSKLSLTDHKNGIAAETDSTGGNTKSRRSLIQELS